MKKCKFCGEKCYFGFYDGKKILLSKGYEWSLTLNDSITTLIPHNCEFENLK